MGRALIAVAALCIGLLLPRRRAAAASGFGVLLALAAMAGSLYASRLSIVAGLALFVALPIAAAAVFRAAPQLGVFLLLSLAAAASGALPSRSPWVLLPVAAVAAALAWFRVGFAMRVACALLCARLLTLLLPGEVPPWQTLALAAATLAFSTLWQAPEPQRAPLLRDVLGVAAAVGVLSAAVVAGAVLFAPVAPVTPRLTRLAAGRGGLVWAAPSEALVWDEPRDPALFPAFPNLDARWLGAPEWLVVKLPGTAPAGRLGLHGDIAALRQVKDAGELARLRSAAQATVEALHENLRLIRPGVTEAELARALLESMRRRGCAPMSFPPIVASGRAAATAHGSGNGGVLKAGELVMIDVGCMAQGYASDFTRTLPVDGRFTPEQRKLYDAVYGAQQAALASCRAGARMNGPGSLSAVARKFIADRGIDAHNGFGISHSVGLFVHDVETGAPLAKGMVLTIEPGVYQPGKLGMRVEDTYVVGEGACDDLTAGFPASAVDVERALASR